MRHPKKNLRAYVIIRIAIITILLSGCAAPKTIQTNSPAQRDHSSALPPAKMPHIAKPLEKNGSLWADNSSLGTMFINAKARLVGDIVTIKIEETSSATNKATTDTDRKSSINAGLTNFFNLEAKYPSTKTFFNPFSSVQSSYQDKFGGSGSTARSGALTAYITARIIQILPNGNFIIEGNREVRVNNENQVITLTGLVRPRDISADNIIQSTYIADAKISYSGSGVINDQQRPGWLMRILDNIWPF